MTNTTNHPAGGHAKDTLTIATRESPLALWQAHYVQRRLQAAHPHLTVNLLGMTTRGDQILESPLAKIGGKGLFVKELETALLDGRADLAVHSMKDVPMSFPEGLRLAVICEREDPRDAFVSNQFQSLAQLPSGAKIGTSSLRRQCQLQAMYPNLDIISLRGNVNTRLRKLDDGDYDAIILAAAGLIRLGFEDRISEYLAPEISLPAAGQGAVGIECRADDTPTQALLQCLDHRETRCRVLAERALNNQLNGGCQVPIAAFSEISEQQLTLRALVGSPDGRQMLRVEGSSAINEGEALGVHLANELLSRGAAEILAAVYNQ